MTFGKLRALLETEPKQVAEMELLAGLAGFPGNVCPLPNSHLVPNPQFPQTIPLSIHSHSGQGIAKLNLAAYGLGHASRGGKAAA